MRRWFEAFPSVLRSPDGGGSGSDTMRVDPGAEVQLGDPDEPPDEPAPGGKKGAGDDEIETLRQRLKDSEDDAKFWADRAKRQPAAAPASRAAEPEPARRREPDAPVAEKPEDVIDDINKRGLAALKDRGYLTKEDLAEALEVESQKTEERINDARSEAEFSGRLSSEFPEMMEDSARAAKGLAPKSELFVKAGEIYRNYVDLDPSLKGSRGLLLIAARQAKAEIDGKGKGGKGGKGGDVDDSDLPPSQRRKAAADVGDRQEQRRAKIERQTPSRSKDDDEDTRGGDDEMSAEAREIGKRLKVSPEQFRKESEKLRTGGGARRGRN